MSWSTADFRDRLKDYELKNVQTNRRQIGHGAYGSVEEVEVEGVVCAAKRIYPVLVNSNNDDGSGEGVKRTKEKFVQECILMSKLRHPHIVQFLGVFFPSAEDVRRERTFSLSLSQSFSQLNLPRSPPPMSSSMHAPSLPWLVMEYLPYTLDHILEKRPNIPIHVKVSFLLDIAKGLLYLHNNKIFHRDLTARNILITSSMVAKIADFGVARIFDPTSNSTAQPGNILYMPPEAFQDVRGRTDYNDTIDVFSFGVIVLFTLTQMFPNELLSATYPDENKPGGVLGRTEIERRIKYFDIAEHSFNTNEDKQLMKLCQHCLQNDPKSRPKAMVIHENLIVLEKSLYNSRLDSSMEMWKKDKLEMVAMLEERQRTCNDVRIKSISKENSKEVQLLLEKVVYLENENRRLREQTAGTKQLQNENEQLKSELTIYEEKLNLVSEDFRQLRQDYDTLQSSLSEKQILLDRSKEEYSLLSQTSQDLQHAINFLEDEKAQHIVELEQLQQDKRTLEEEKINLTREKERLSSRNHALPSMSYEIERLHAENDRLRQIIRKKEDERSSVGGETQLLRERVLKLSEDNEKLRHYSHLPAGTTFKPPPLPDSGIQVNLPLFWKECTKSTYGQHGARCVLYRKKVLYGGGEGSEDDRCKILEFDLTRFQWGEFSRLTYEQFAMAVVQGKLYLVGGFKPSQDEYSSQVCQWNEEGKYWSSINRNLPVPRCDAAAIGYSRYLIVAGGFNGEPLDSVNVLDCENFGQWQSLCSLPSPAYALQSTAYISTVTRTRTIALWYLLSSSRGSGISRKCPVYAISLPHLLERRGNWSVIPDPPFADSGVVTMRGHLLAVGGRDKHTERKEIHMYFPGTSEWLNVASLEYPRHSVTCLPLNDKKFIVLGGKDESSEYSTKVDQYNMTIS